MGTLKEHWKLTIFLVLIVGGIYYLRTWFHGLGMIPLVHPWLALSIGLSLGIPVLLFGFLDKCIGDKLLAITVIFTILLTVLTIVTGMFAGPFTKGHIANNREVQEIDTLPEMSSDYIRILPKTVGRRYVDDSLQYPKFQIGDEDITIIDNEPHWSYPLIPNGFINKFDEKCKGGVFVNMSTSDKDIKTFEQEMNIGPGMLVTDSVWWNMYKDDYWRNMNDTFPIVHENKLYYAFPEINYNVKFSFPTAFSVPTWGGITLVSPDGEMNKLSPEEAQDSEILKGQQIFPYELARYYVESQALKHGVMNYWFDHKDQIELTDVPGQGNKQPFLVNTKDGLKWFASVEPYGDAHGVFRIYIVDARTGEMSYWEPQKDESLIGPTKAIDHVKKQFPTINWSTGSKNRGFNTVEPIPVIVDNELWWEVRVIPADSAGVSKIAFVNAKNTNKVIKTTNDIEVIKFQTASQVIEQPKENEMTLREQAFELIEKYNKIQDREQQVVDNLTKILEELEEK